MPQGIWVIAEQKDGKLKKVSLELLSKAKEMGQEVTALLLGSGVEGLAAAMGQYGADKVLLFDAGVLKDYSTDAYTKVICDAVKEGDPSVLLGPATASGKDFLPKVAARLNTGLASDCIDLKLVDGKLVATRPIYAGKCMVETVTTDASPQMASIRPNVLAVGAADASKSAEVVKKAVNVSDADMKAVLKEILKGASERVDLTEATVIVSGGRAMKEANNFKLLWDLAEALGSGTKAGDGHAGRPHDAPRIEHRRSGDPDRVEGQPRSLRPRRQARCRLLLPRLAVRLPGALALQPRPLVSPGVELPGTCASRLGAERHRG